MCNATQSEYEGFTTTVNHGGWQCWNTDPGPGKFLKTDGGMMTGLGRSPTEQHYFCPRTAVALNYHLIGYHMGTMNDYPDAECLINESHLG